MVCYVTVVAFLITFLMNKFTTTVILFCLLKPTLVYFASLHLCNGMLSWVNAKLDEKLT